jgi:CHAT domain-containing protein/tetratricopeptide (TPR) repeat protein
VKSADKAQDKLTKLFASLVELPDEASRGRFISRHRNLLSAEVVEALAETVRENLRVDLNAAQALAGAAVTIANRIGRKDAQGRAYRAQATTLWFTGQYRPATELYQQAVRLFEDAGLVNEVGRTLSGAIQPLILLGEYDAALAAARKAREIFSDQNDNYRLARLAINIGNIYHRQDRFAEALDNYQQSYDKLVPFDDAEGIAVALHNMAVCLITLNEFHRALAIYEKARSYCQEHHMPLLVAQADYNIAYLHYLRGEYARAIEMLQAARAACQKVGDNYHTALCLLDLSEVYLELNMSEEASETADLAQDGFKQLGMGYETAKALAYRGMALSQQEKGFRGLELFNQAREVFVREKNQVWPSLIDLYVATVQFNEGRWYEARRSCNAALEFFRSSPLHSKTVLCRLLLVRIALRIGDTETARRECGTALGLIEGLDIPALAHQAHFLMGEIGEATHDPRAARDSYLKACGSMETLRNNLRRDEMKIAFMKNRVEVYENLVGLCLADAANPASAAEALRFVEQAKSRALRDLVLPRGHSIVPEQPGQSDLVRQIRELREELNWYYHRIAVEELRPAETSRVQLEGLEAQARQREKELIDSLRELPASPESAADLVPASVAGVDIIREALLGETAMIEYFAVRGRFMAILVSRHSLELIPLTMEARVANLLRLLHFQLSKFRLGSTYTEPFRKTMLDATKAHLRELYRELIEPFHSRLQGFEHLIFVPHRLLHYLPFHAFHDGEKYLIDRFTISYAPSATIYGLCHQKSANATGPSLIMGVPDPQAPSILEEVQAVAATLPEPDLLLGASASEANLKERGPRSRLVHIATHGYFRQDNPMFSGIRLGTSYLSLFDLYSLKLPVSLVTLSGCTTGVNVVAAGDELLGLARGLLSAGEVCFRQEPNPCC